MQNRSKRNSRNKLASGILIASSALTGVVNGATNIANAAGEGEEKTGNQSKVDEGQKTKFNLFKLFNRGKKSEQEVNSKKDGVQTGIVDGTKNTASAAGKGKEKTEKQKTKNKFFGLFSKKGETEQKLNTEQDNSKNGKKKIVVKAILSKIVNKIKIKSKDKENESSKEKNIENKNVDVNDKINEKKKMLKKNKSKNLRTMIGVRKKIKLITLS